MNGSIPVKQYWDSPLSSPLLLSQSDPSIFACWPIANCLTSAQQSSWATQQFSMSSFVIGLIQLSSFYSSYTLIIKYLKMKNSLPHETILANLNKQQGINADHPLFYTKQRTQYLQRLTHKINIETELPTVDLRRNMRVDQYLNQYNHIKNQHQKEVRVRNTLLNTKQFHSIFQEDELEKRKQKRNRLQNRSIQENLYRNYVQDAQFYHLAQRDDPSLEEPPQTLLALGDQKRVKELYLIDLQMGKLKQQQRLQKMVRDRRQSCQNNSLIGKLSTSIISSYMVYFDQIYALLIDQIIEEEVIFLNHMEAQFKVNQSMPLPKNSMESKQTLQMMELVKSLQDLCDD